MFSVLQDYFRVVKQFLPNEQEVSAVGLDIGTRECTLVELTRSGNTFKLVHWRIEPIHNGNIKSAIEKTLGQLDISSKSIYTSISGKGTLIRYIDMPKMRSIRIVIFLM